VTELERQWAWSRVEGMADGSLDKAEDARMRAAMARDEDLARAVTRAVALRRALKQQPRVSIPRSLRGRLLALASRAPEEKKHRFALRAAWVLGLAAAVAGIGFLTLARRAPEPTPTRRALEKEQQTDAVADFAIAMTYLHRSAVIARMEVTQAVGGGLRDAVVISRKVAREDKRQRHNGG
jgi:anti-sigma factor RsiW